jgi:hypothetical protein
MRFPHFVRTTLLLAAGVVFGTPLAPNHAAHGQSGTTTHESTAQASTAQASTAQASNASATTSLKPAPLRVAVIGASASAGFGCTLREKRDDGEYGGSFRLADMLKLACPDLAIVTTDASSGFFFLAPIENGSKAAARALEFKPDCVVALDYLFWYCYGDDAPDGGAITNEAQRLEKLERGLKQLERFEVPVIVGDIPDMSPAVGKMLAARQMPASDTLSQANARFAAWAKGRANVRVVPLARMQKQLMEQGTLEVGSDRMVSTKDAPLLQRDALHPTPFGLAGLACAVAHELKETLPMRANATAESPASDADGCEPDPEDTVTRARGTLARRATPRPSVKKPEDSATPSTN